MDKFKRPVASFALLALFASLVPRPGFAQIPTIAPPIDEVEPGIPLSPEEFGRRNSSFESVYLLGGGDRLSIDIFEAPQFSGLYQVPVDGIIYLPLIGAIEVGGLTIQQASDGISKKYAAFLKRPLVTIRLLNTRPLNIFVSGEVFNPGSFTLDLIGGEGDNPGVQHPTITEAIRAAGGITLAADISQVRIRRRLPGGGEETFLIDFSELLETAAPPRSLTLRDGDSIFIPTATEVSLKEVRNLARLDFAANIEAGRTVSVTGEVKRPGSYFIQISTPGIQASLPTVSLAIQEAGGIEPLADIRNIQLRRQTKSGPEQVFEVNLWELLQTGDISQDTILQDGDTIVVPKASEISSAEATELANARFAPDSIRVSVVGEVKNPGLVQLPPNTPLNQAIATAGGFNDSRADEDDVRLIRLNPDGSVLSREVAVDLTRGISEQSNPILRDNDIIVVDRNRATSISDSISNFLGAGANALAVFSIPSRIFGILEVLGILDNNNN